MGLTPPEIIRQALAQRVVERVDGTGMIPAAVMILLYRKEGEYCILLNKRSEEVEHLFWGAGWEPILGSCV